MMSCVKMRNKTYRILIYDGMVQPRLDYQTGKSGQLPYGLQFSLDAKLNHSISCHDKVLSYVICGHFLVEVKKICSNFVKKKNWF